MTPLECLARSCPEIEIPDGQPTDCRTCRPPISGVYVLVRGRDIVYVGSSEDIVARLFWHRAGHRLERKQFDSALVLRLPASVIRSYEGALIRFLRPPYNRSAPRNLGNDEEIIAGLGLDAAKHDQIFVPVTRQQSGFSRRLRAARITSKMRAVDVADRLGVTRSTYYHWEQGIREPDHASEAELARLFGVSLSQLREDPN